MTATEHSYVHTCFWTVEGIGGGATNYSQTKNWSYGPKKCGILDRLSLHGSHTLSFKCE